MSKTYLLVDFSNLFHRMKHTTMKNATQDERLGMVIHQMIRGMANAWRKFDVDHCVICLEGKSWRYDVYEGYKLSRKVKKLARTEAEMLDDEEFQKAADELSTFLQEKTAASVIQTPRAEADDIIATFIHDRPNDIHIILSTDSDFHQLLKKPNVTIFDPMKPAFITAIGYYDVDLKPIIDKKTGVQKTLGDPEYVLFKKIIRGDASDCIKSAYPFIPEKSTKSRVGIIEAFNDRKSKEFAWNTVMLSEWVDHNDVRHVVKDVYERNKLLIDLEQIPEHIRDEIREALHAEFNKEFKLSNLVMAFSKFCRKWELVSIAQYMDSNIQFMSKRYE